MLVVLITGLPGSGKSTMAEVAGVPSGRRCSATTGP